MTVLMLSVLEEEVSWFTSTGPGIGEALSASLYD